MRIDYQWKYRALRTVIDAGDVTNFESVFTFISKTRFSKDTRISSHRLKTIRLEKNATEEELIKMSNAINTSPDNVRSLFS